MDKLELIIPSPISQSLFMERDKFINLNGSEINYFYLLLYLYKEKLLTVNGILDNDGYDNYTLNQDTDDFSVEIRLWWFDKYKAVKSKKYTKLKSFLKKLQHYHILINVLEKNKADGIEEIKLVKSYSINKATINIEFNKSFLEKYIVYGSQFMAVDLNNLIKLRGEKTKLLYLILKDYSNLPKGKNLTVADLMLIFGCQEIKENIIKKYVEKINALNDIKVNLDVVGPAGEKIYKFKFEKEEVKSDKSNSNDDNPLSDFSEDTQNKAYERMKKEQADGTVVKKEIPYLLKTCKSIVEEEKYKEEQANKYQEEKLILDDINIKDFMDMLHDKYGDYVSIKDYKLVYLYDEKGNKPLITNNALETLEILEALE